MIGVSVLFKVIWNRGIAESSLKICKFNQLHAFVNEWNFVKKTLMIDLRIYIRTKEMLNITLSQQSCLM